MKTKPCEQCIHYLDKNKSPTLDRCELRSRFLDCVWSDFKLHFESSQIGGENE